MQNARQHTLALSGLSLKVLETQSVEASACEIAVSVRESPQGLEGWCIYKTALFDTTTITRMLEAYQQVLGSLITQPEQPLSALSVSGKAESVQNRHHTCLLGRLT